MIELFSSGSFAGRLKFLFDYSFLGGDVSEKLSLFFASIYSSFHSYPSAHPFIRIQEFICLFAEYFICYCLQEF